MSSIDHRILRSGDHTGSITGPSSASTDALTCELVKWDHVEESLVATDSLREDGFWVNLAPTWERDMKQTRSNIDSHDWGARASEALAQAKKLPPGSKRSEAIRKAGQLRAAADMKNWLIAKVPVT